MKKTFALLLSLTGLAQAAFVWIGETPITDSSWNDQYNWAITGNTSFGGNDGHWGGSGPGIPNSNKWDQITLNNAAGTISTLEGWCIQMKLVSTTLTVQNIKKFQHGDGGKCQLDIDAASILTLQGYSGGNDGGGVTLNCEGVFNLAYTKNQGGEGFAADLGKTGIMNLTSSSGTAYTAKLKSLTATLETEAITGKRSLVTLGENMSFDNTSTAITIQAGDNWQQVNNEQEARQAAEEGQDSFWVSKEADGIFLSWIKGESESVPEPSTATLSLLALAALVARRRRK